MGGMTGKKLARSKTVYEWDARGDDLRLVRCRSMSAPASSVRRQGGVEMAVVCAAIEVRGVTLQSCRSGRERYQLPCTDSNMHGSVRPRQTASADTVAGPRASASSRLRLSHAAAVNRTPWPGPTSRGSSVFCVFVPPLADGTR